MSPPRADAVTERASRARGIAVRNCDSFTGLEPNRFIRLAVRAPDENRRLLTALAEMTRP
jgi:histidinol-phosphate/aromatic aminotransferase/cobyric acid decarboxylase-like protein